MRHLTEAFKMYGVKEVLGEKDNPAVLALFDELGFNGKDLKDETSWCAAFVNTILKRAGMPYQRKLNARSFLVLGEQVSVPKLGDIVVFWRESPSSWKGHVGFYISENDNYIYVLGGNQANQVKISAYSKKRLLQYRRIIKN